MSSGDVSLDTSREYKEDLSPITHQQTSKKGQHICQEPGCNAAFHRPYRLKNHIAAYHNHEKLFKCPYEDCGKSYTNQSHLKRHKIIAHIGEVDESNQVVCTIDDCNGTFANKYSLKKHINRKHTNHPFKCEICDEEFQRKSHLSAHKVSQHAFATPYKCEQCGDTFVNLHLFNKHCSRHRTYKCDCAQIFVKWTEYLEHRKTECSCPKQPTLVHFVPKSLL